MFLYGLFCCTDKFAVGDGVCLGLWCLNSGCLLCCFLLIVGGVVLVVVCCSGFCILVGIARIVFNSYFVGYCVCFVF